MSVRFDCTVQFIYISGNSHMSQVLTVVHLCISGDSHRPQVFMAGCLFEVLLYVHRNSRFIRNESPGHPPWPSHSSWALIGFDCIYKLFIFLGAFHNHRSQASAQLIYISGDNHTSQALSVGTTYLHFWGQSHITGFECRYNLSIFLGTITHHRLWV